jgi:anti-sigma regulatory factor (Ser/Thr protein kinase)
VLVAVSEGRIALLSDALGPDSEHIRFADIRELGRNPARIIPAWREFLDEHEGRSVLGIGEPVWAGRCDEELQECELHEWLLNAAFDDGPGWELLCPYDTEALDADAVAAAHRSHPHVGTDGLSFASDCYDPAFVTLQPPLAPPPSEALAFEFTVTELSQVRAHVAAASNPLLGGARTQDLILAANELATNSVTHGGGAGTLRLWSDGAELVCEVDDRGRLADPLVGRKRPDQRQLTGRGLWIVNQLCDLVQIRAGAQGTTIRVRMRAQS